MSNSPVQPLQVPAPSAPPRVPDPPLLPPAALPLERTRAALLYRLATATLLLLAAALWALYLVHLRADFPNFSPWGDWAKYTDEGWYGDGAIRHVQWGSWFVRGDFNPAVALPVLPLLESAVFRVTGVGIAPARALAVLLFACTLLAAFALLRRVRTAAGHPATLAAAAAVLLLAASPFFFAFMRLAILEPPLLLALLLALHAAESVPAAGIWFGSPLRDLLPVASLGLLVLVLVLTKTTTIFLLPAIFFLVWARGQFRIGPLLRNGAIAAAIAAGLWVAYFVLFVRPNYLPDYRYLFAANAYTGVTLRTAPAITAEMIRDTVWIGPVRYVFAAVLALAAIALVRRPVDVLRRHRIAVALLLLMAGYAAFLVYHNNLQARYYLVLAVPMTLFTTLTLEQIAQTARDVRKTQAAQSVQPAHLWPRGLRVAAQAATAAGALALAAVVASGAREIVRNVRHPEYTLLNAANQIAALIRADPGHSQLVLSISGSELSLFTGLRSLCDDFGVMELPDRVALYHPGWFVAWNAMEDDKMEALLPLYQPHRVAAFPVMDDPDRNLLIVYRLDPPSTTPPQRRPGHSTMQHHRVSP